jgi:hypothetical protein
MPPEPGFARREAHHREENTRATDPVAGACALPSTHTFSRRGLHGGTRGFPRA